MEYTKTTGAQTDPERVLEDGAVVGRDPDTGAWYVARTTVVEVATRTLTRWRSAPIGTAAEALDEAKALAVPVKVRGDDREAALAEPAPPTGDPVDHG